MAKPITITSPDLDYKIRLANQEDDTIFEAEAIYIDHLLAKSQTNVDLDQEDAVVEGLPRFTEMLNKKFNVEISGTDAFFIARESVRLMVSLKKKYASMSMSQQPTESTPST